MINALAFGAAFIFLLIIFIAYRYNRKMSLINNHVVSGDIEPQKLDTSVPAKIISIGQSDIEFLADRNRMREYTVQYYDEPDPENGNQILNTLARTVLARNCDEAKSIFIKETQIAKNRIITIL